MASDEDVGDDPPPRGGGSPGMNDRSAQLVRSPGTDPPDTPSMGLFAKGVSSLWRCSAMNITSRQRRSSPQDFSGISILPNESRNFSRGVIAHTVISNQDGSITELSVPGIFVSPKSDRQQQQQQQTSPFSSPRGGDSDGYSYFELDSIAIAIANAKANGNANSTQNGSIGPSSVPSEVNITQDPPTPKPSSSSKSSDPEGSVASLNLTNQSTIRKMDNIIKEINVQENNNNDTSKKEDTMSVMTGSGGMDWEYHLDLDHIQQLNEIPTTYNLHLFSRWTPQYKGPPILVI